jgi:HAD superfamily hydrolase (TIGR01662 family)
MMRNPMAGTLDDIEVPKSNLIVLLMGYNASGKSTIAADYVAKGFDRLNRDEMGGSLEGVAQELERRIKKGGNLFVLDNTYATIESRASVIKIGKAAGIPVTCVHLETSFEDAQLNACLRMVKKHGRLLTPEEMKKTNDPNMFPPVALFNYRKTFEKPTWQEGFAVTSKLEFKRYWGPEYKNSALILDYDGNLRDTPDGAAFDFPTCAEEVILLPGRVEKIKAYIKEHKPDHVLGWSNQSGIAKKQATEENVIKAFKRTNELLGMDIPFFYCPHNIPPVSCYCRKPHPGNGALMIEMYKLNPAKCLFVGDQKTDETAAERCGFNYMHTEEFFK